MSEMIIKTNNQPRDLLDISDLSPLVLKEFDWIDLGQEWGFFRFKKELYHLSQFEVVGGSLGDVWDGAFSTSMTTAVLVRLDKEAVIVGTMRC